MFNIHEAFVTSESFLIKQVHLLNVLRIDTHKAVVRNIIVVPFAL